MSFQNKNPKKTDSWKALDKHFLKMQHVKMQDLFDKKANRANRFHVSWEDFLFDYSKNKINETTVQLLLNFAKEMQLNQGIDAMYSGEKINVTENRSVGHVWLRDLDNHFKSEFHSEIKESLQMIRQFSENILDGTIKSSSNQKFTDVINIGIGGSDLGPKLVTESLEDYQTDLNIHYISNIDYDCIQHQLKRINPETTLVIIISKSFTTKETLANAQIIKEWLQSHQVDISKHLVAVTSSVEKAIDYGIPKNHIFPMWDWVGGRFSLWSSVGLPIALGIGYQKFEELLKGAHQVDLHLKNTPLEKNIPVLMALISLWYANFFGYETEAVIPYSNRLKSLPAFLQQVVMESNGKNVSRKGELVDYQTCNIIWGEIGTNSQHAFFQLFHQGTKIIPSDFIGFIQPFRPSKMHHNLMANFFAQTEGLMNGKEGKLYEKNVNENDSLKPFKFFKGNRPTNTLLIQKLTPESLGKLLAIYEHKTFVQGYLWNIYSFDQFGVEYGKILADSLSNEIKEKNIATHDSSTSFLLNHYLKNQ